MTRKLASVLMIVFLVATAGMVDGGDEADAQSPSASDSVSGKKLGVLPPSVAGAFYPADADKLRADIGRYLESASPPAIDGEIAAVIVPHAGYIYSGPVAAYAYKAIARQAEKWSGDGDKGLDAVFVLAFSHRGGFNGVSVYYEGSVETPLGRAAVNEKIAGEFMSLHPRLSFSQRVFQGEHSAEVQIPFLQSILPDVPIVPVIFGQQGVSNIEAVSDALVKIAEKYRILVVATSDLSHYHPYEEANALDGETVRLIVDGNPRKMVRHIDEHSGAMCGPAPVVAALSFAESRHAAPVLLKYANSGDTAGRKDAVVGYASIAFVRNESAKADKPGAGNASGAETEAEDYLSDEDKETLLRLARSSVESIVRDKKILAVEAPEGETLRANGAGFVTLKINGRLRGCVGRMEAVTPLYQTIVQMAAAAATQDRRFRPVKPEELDDIHIEISVNTPLRPVAGPEDITLGKHGVVVAKGLRQGVFLPQVADETGWSKDEFLRNLCAHKAGLEPDAYKDGARLYVFSSIVFEEEK